MSSIVNKIAHALTPGNSPGHTGSSTSGAGATREVDPIDGRPVGKHAADLVRGAESHRNMTNMNNTTGFNNRSQVPLQSHLQSSGQLPAGYDYGTTGLSQQTPQQGINSGNVGHDNLGRNKLDTAAGSAGTTGGGKTVFNNIMNTGENAPTNMINKQEQPMYSGMAQSPRSQGGISKAAAVLGMEPARGSTHRPDLSGISNYGMIPAAPPLSQSNFAPKQRTGITDNDLTRLSVSRKPRLQETAQPLQHTTNNNPLVSGTEAPEGHVKPISMPEVRLNPVDTSIPMGDMQKVNTPKLHAIKVNSTFSSNSARHFESPESHNKISDLMSKLTSTSNELDLLAKERLDQISREAQAAIAKILGATESNQKQLVEDSNKRSDDIDNTYKQQLQLYVTGLDKIRANSLATLEKEFEQRQSELLNQAKNNIENINQEANRQKSGVLDEIQRQSLNKISNITDNVAALALQDATKRLNSTITTTITTNTKGLLAEQLEKLNPMKKSEGDYGKRGSIDNTGNRDMMSGNEKLNTLRGEKMSPRSNELAGEPRMSAGGARPIV